VNISNKVIRQYIASRTVQHSDYPLSPTDNALKKPHYDPKVPES
jgi:hypothetical protein